MRKTIFILTLTLILSCSSDSDNETLNSKLKLTKIDHFNDGEYTGSSIFEYDEELKLIAQKDNSGNTILSYHYENDKITSVITDDYTISYNYDNELIISSFNSSNNTSAEYLYNSQSQLTTLNTYDNEILQCEINHTFNMNGNIENVMNSCFNSMSNTFEYDNMKNQNALLYNSGLLKVYGVAFCENNITRVLDINSNVLYTIDYQYNNQGYPTVSTTTIPSTISGNLIFRDEYTYQNL
jgi:hypothetical protein